MAEEEEGNSKTVGELKLSVNIDIASPEVRKLIDKAAGATAPDEALAFSQAALNVAHAQQVFMDVAFPRDVEATGFGEDDDARRRFQTGEE